MRAGVTARPFDADFHEFGRAFAIADDQMRQLAAEIGERGGEGVGARIVHRSQRRIARLAGREGEYGVAGRGIAIHGDAGKGPLVRGRKHLLQQRRFDRGVGEDIAQHRRHVGRDHARSLDDADQIDARLADQRAGAGALGIGVGGADRDRRFLPVAGGGAEGCLQPRLGLVDGQRHADDPGRGDEDIRRQAGEAIGDLGRDGFHRSAAAVPGEGIGIAGIDHQRARRAQRNGVAAPFDFG